MEFIGTLVATFVGAALALAAERFAKMRDAKNIEEAAVNNLLLDLAAKRALAQTTLDDRWSEGSGLRIIESVNHTRGLIRDTRLQLRPGSPYLDPLRRMTRACTTFMEQAEYRRDGPTRDDLNTLAASVRAEAIALRKAAPRRELISDAPGSFTLNREIDRNPEKLP